MTLVPFDDRDGFIWIDGSLVAWRDATLHVLSHGLHYASSVFEGERAYGGSIFKLREHTERLIRSAALLGFKVPWSAAEIDQACQTVLSANGLEDAYLRPVAWRGAEQLSVSARGNRTHLAIACWAWPNLFAGARLTGVRLGMAPWRRADPQTAPTGSKAAGLYMTGTLSKDAALDEGFDDALMLDWRGKIAEATGANVFLVMDGVLHTPEPTGFLDGITRRTVMELAKRRQIKVVERVIEEAELADASEVFLTGTAAEVTPVRQIGALRYTPGAITAAMVSDYAALVRAGENETGRVG